MRAVIILSNIDKIDMDLIKDSFIIGADRGAYNAIKNGIVPDISIGDFDSCNKEELDKILEVSKRIIKLNPIKDSTDTNEAINLVKDYDEIIILGGIKGKRIEHFYANLILLKNNPNVIMIDDNSLIEIKSKSFTPRLDYKYFSLFSLSLESLITLSGFKYDLDKYLLKINDPLCVSNEITSNPYVDIEYGLLLVIYSNEDNI